MVLTPSTMQELGNSLPQFSVTDLNGQKVTPEIFNNKRGILVMFISKHCPYVQHIIGELTRLSQDYKDSQLGMVAFSSNDTVNYPDDSPENLGKMAAEHNLQFPICFDETQEVAKAFGAACTPDFFLYGPDCRLVYRGQLDGSRPGNNIPCDGSDLRSAIEAVLSGESVPTDQMPSVGCNIKWKAGNEPDYFKG